MTIDPKQIDTAYEHFHEFAKVTGGTTRSINAMREEFIFKDGALSAKYKTLMGAIWGISARCEPCLTYYVLKAKELGISEAELGEALAVASTMGGCVGETWALKAFKVYKSSETVYECACEV